MGITKWGFNKFKVILWEWNARIPILAVPVDLKLDWETGITLVHFTTTGNEKSTYRLSSHVGELCFLLNVASFPGLPHFSSSVCVQYNARKLPCIILNAN